MHILFIYDTRIQFKKQLRFWKILSSRWQILLILQSWILLVILWHQFVKFVIHDPSGNDFITCQDGYYLDNQVYTQTHPIVFDEIKKNCVLMITNNIYIKDKIKVLQYLPTLIIALVYAGYQFFNLKFLDSEMQFFSVYQMYP
ncbi:unnamed protein product [Paramecium pentaurelia]|uniref:Transmembrane protein n=1 Tax=Paramecium pentaurelia TaxID=43138 RepID=A0A8S1Y954_9CILI|nr:unnamed protein product [Paramecium pentaurelia]